VDVVKINRRLAIPMDELALSATRSSGPGGQNVNKVATQVMLRFDVANSPSLTEWQRSRILSRLRNRITTDGELVLTSQEHRTQRANRAAAVERCPSPAKRPAPPRRPSPAASNPNENAARRKARGPPGSPSTNDRF